MARSPFVTIEGVEDLRFKFGDPSELLDAIGAIGVIQTQRNFEEQHDPEGVPWEVRYPQQTTAPIVNIAGLLTDWNAGANPPARRFQNTPVNIDSSTLARSIAHQVISADTVEWGSDVEYAQEVQAGGKGTAIPITTTSIDKLTEFLQDMDKDERKPWNKRLGWLYGFFNSGLDYNPDKVPRPFVGMTDELEEEINEEVRVFFEGDDVS